jgi:hypothetical protein
MSKKPKAKHVEKKNQIAPTDARVNETPIESIEPSSREMPVPDDTPPAMEPEAEEPGEAAPTSTRPPRDPSSIGGVAILTFWENGHAGPGWYFYDEEYPEDGSTGAYESAKLAEEDAIAHGFSPRYSRKALYLLHPNTDPIVPGVISSLTFESLMAKRDEMATRRAQPGARSRWPDNYPETCLCNPPAHTAEEINRDGSFHARWCPEYQTPTPRPTPPV